MNIQGTHNLQILRGLSTNLSLLSCTENGGNIDLWNKDDGSGRQQWEIKLIDGRTDVYHIIVKDGVMGDK
ncbi:MAG: hypothetical protein HRT38_11035, partial [Alteromonadaceae bacterium]|nr:hypothetical protein [Alteromonadaceae bacterium]